MHVILSSVKRRHVPVYLDDIVVFSKKPVKNNGNVRSAVTLLWIFGVTLEPESCQFFIISINYLGHGIQPKHLKIASHSSIDIHNLNSRTIVKQLKSFLLLPNGSRRFFSS